MASSLLSGFKNILSGFGKAPVPKLPTSSSKPAMPMTLNTNKGMVTTPTPNMSMAPKPNMSVASQKFIGPVMPKVNSSSATVLAQQRALNAKGANLKLDGIMGPLTQAAMAKYSTATPPVRQASTVVTPNQKTINPATGSTSSNNYSNNYSNSSGNYEGPTYNGPSPVVPEVDPLDPYRKDVSSMEKIYMKNMGLSSDETNTQSELDMLENSFKTGYQGIEDKVIPLEFQTGQKASLEKRALNLAEPLEQKLSRLQAQRMSALDASKFALGRADSRLKEEMDKNKLVEGSSFYDPKTKSWIRPPADPEKAADGFTLGAGQARYDANGNLIASVADPAIADAAAAKGKAAQGFTDIIDQLLASDTATITGISGVLDPRNYIPGSAAQKTKNMYEQLKGMLSLANRQQLKGSGAISDFESRTLEKAASSLGRNLSDADFIATLKQLKRDLASGGGSGGNSGGGTVQTKIGPINTNW